MAGLGRFSALTVVVTLLVSAGAASAAAGSGTLDVQGFLAFDGDVSMAPSAGALFVGFGGVAEPASPDGSVALDLNAARVTVTRVTWTKAQLATDPTGVVPVTEAAWEPPVVEEFQFTDAVLGVERTMGDGARVVLSSDALHADASRVALTNGELRGITEYVAIPKVNARHGSERASGAGAAGYEFVVRDGFDVATLDGTRVDIVADAAELYVLGFDLVVTTADGSQSFATGEERSAPADGVPASTARTVTYVVATIDGAHGSATVTGAKAHWYESAPNLIVDGTARAASAAGRVEAGAREYAVRDESVAITGALAIAPERTSAGDSRSSDEPATDPGFRAHVSGDVTSVVVASQPKYTSEAKVAAAAGVVGLAAVVVFWSTIKYWLTVALIPLYSRLKEPELLENEVRNEIYRIIRDNPGISARAIHRAAGQSWGTVVYHLRQLEKHHFVTSRRVGRSRNFYENHGKYRGMEVGLATLNSARAVVLARAVVAEPGLTQERLTTITDLPQPTVSYYVRKLKDASLIEEVREGRYARYFPSADLAKLIAIAEPDASAEASAAPAPA